MYKNMKTIFFTFCTLLILTGCRQKTITNPVDYSIYLQSTQHSGLIHIDEEMAFWQKRLATAPAADIIAQSKIAGLLTRRFSYSGNVAELHQADSLYRLVHVLNRTSSSGTFRSLAANCITQHKFLQAQQYIDSALVLGDDKYLTVLMEFDVAMELGNPYRARKALNSLVDKNSFEYLIREAKYKDHVQGDLDAAIVLMEKAYDKIKDNPNRALHTWIKSNLGDLYGHANRYRASYTCYLDALAKDPACYHALKGIAWLAFSHDKDITQANTILQFLQQQHPVPDYELLLAEIAAYENDTVNQQQHIRQFMTATKNSMYGSMYNKYLFNLAANELNDVKQCLQLAKQEVQHRPTPEAYSWLAWAYYKNGHIQKAMDIARWSVQNKCFEPDALYYLGMIYRAGNNSALARKYLTEAAGSAYELGPVLSRQISETLKTL
jgi:tetratricopeptide (TPR) repeat protein